MKKIIAFLSLAIAGSAWAGVQVQQGDALVTFGSMTLTTNGGGVRFADGTVQTSAAGSGSFSGINVQGSPTISNQATLIPGTNIGMTQSGNNITVNDTNAATISAVNAGPGLKGGGTSGSVTVSISSVSLSTQTVGILPVANGGSGTNSPGLIAGTNITSITGSWPNQTINATTQGGGSGSGFSGVNSSGNPIITSTATLLAGTNVTLTQAGSTITINASGSVGGSGYALEPATVTIQATQAGIIASTITVSTLTVTNAVQLNGTGNLSFVNPPDGLTYQVIGSSTSCTAGQTWVVGSSNTAVCVNAGGGSGTITSVTAGAGLVGGGSSGGVTVSVSSVSLSTQVVGNLPVTNLNSGTSATSLTFWRGDGTWAAPAGGGITPTAGSWSGLPACGSTGLYFPTDSLYSMVLCTSGTRSYLRDGKSFTPPVDANFSWDNQTGAGGGSASTETAHGFESLVISTSVNGSGDLTLLYSTAPATPYTRTFAIIPNIWVSAQGGGYQKWFVGFRENSTGKLLRYYEGNDLADGYRSAYGVDHAATSSSFTGGFGTADVGPILTSDMPHAGVLTYVKLGDDGTNISIAISHDGIEFSTIFLQARGTYMAGSGPTQLMFGGQNGAVGAANTVVEYIDLIGLQ